MLKFVIYTTIGLLLVLFMWGISRDFLPPEHRRGVIGHTLDHSVQKLSIKALMLANELPERRFASQLVTVSSEEVNALLTKGFETGQPVLLYVYSPNCFLCRINLDTINNVAKNFKPRGLLVVALAADTSEAELSVFLDRNAYSLYFTPLLLDQKSYGSLPFYIARLPGQLPGTKMKDIPYIALFQRMEFTRSFMAGLGTEEELHEAIEERLKSYEQTKAKDENKNAK